MGLKKEFKKSVSGKPIRGASDKDGEQGQIARIVGRDGSQVSSQGQSGVMRNKRSTAIRKCRIYKTCEIVQD